MPWGRTSAMTQGSPPLSRTAPGEVERQGWRLCAFLQPWQHQRPPPSLRTQCTALLGRQWLPQRSKKCLETACLFQSWGCPADCVCGMEGKETSRPGIRSQTTCGTGHTYPANHGIKQRKQLLVLLSLDRTVVLVAGSSHNVTQRDDWHSTAAQERDETPACTAALSDLLVASATFLQCFLMCLTTSKAPGSGFALRSSSTRNSSRF